MTSRLLRFMESREIRITHLASASGRHRHYLFYLMRGAAQPTAATIKAVVNGARIVTNDSSVRANDLFPLDDDE